ncbi:hypothetical protein [Brevundimonas sp.]|uniref:hypothetical protein n=1 Tax=Brevundimonas sp. TaxID=1871086 RepID=UPI0035AED013
MHNQNRNSWLVAGGVLSAVAAALHLSIIVGGPPWYRFFGAGETMARMAEAGHWYPTALTLLIATGLSIWAAYAFSGAGLIRRLPLLRTGLVVISLIYLARGLVLVPAMALNPQGPAGLTAFTWWSSLIVLGYGLTYAIGTHRAWRGLAPART